jgi:hypothetical protein
MPTLFAYIDLTTGSMVAQLVLGGAAGVLVLLKLVAARLRSSTSEWFGGRRTKPQ